MTEVQKTVEQEKGVEKTPEKAAVSETGIRNSQMHTCQPLSISAENENTYRVRFQTENGTVEHCVRIDDVELDALHFPLIVGDSGFLELTDGDPAAVFLREALFALHKARHFEYMEEPGKAAEINPAKEDEKRKANA